MVCWRSPPWRVGAPTSGEILDPPTFFAENYMKMKESGPRGRGRPLRPPTYPGSSNAIVFLQTSLYCQFGPRGGGASLPPTHTHTYPDPEMLLFSLYCQFGSAANACKIISLDSWCILGGGWGNLIVERGRESGGGGQHGRSHDVN